MISQFQEINLSIGWKMGIAFGVGLAIGSAVTYLSSKKHFQRVSDSEIDSVREIYISKINDLESSLIDLKEADPEPEVKAKTRKEAQALIIEQGYAEVVIEEDSFQEPYKIISRAEEGESDPDILEFDQEGEVAALLAKGNEAPYIISYEEWCDSDEDGIDKTTISWYEQDRTMADERDEPIDDWDRLVGQDNLAWFGWRSYDESVVYVMNPDISTAFEITKNEGAFSIIVLGDPDLFVQHEPKPRPRKMRKEE